MKLASPVPRVALVLQYFQVWPTHIFVGKIHKNRKSKSQTPYISYDHLEQELLHIIFYFIDDNLSTVIMLTVGWFLILLSSYACLNVTHTECNGGDWIYPR